MWHSRLVHFTLVSSSRVIYWGERGEKNGHKSYCALRHDGGSPARILAYTWIEWKAHSGCKLASSHAGRFRDLEQIDGGVSNSSAFCLSVLGSPFSAHLPFASFFLSVSLSQASLGRHKDTFLPNGGVAGNSFPCSPRVSRYFFSISVWDKARLRAALCSPSLLSHGIALLG